MKIVMNSENKSLTYKLAYNNDLIKELISEIIKNCSIRKRRKYYVEARTTEEAKNKISSTINYNGDKIYENVSDITREPVNDPYGYWRPGDLVQYSFNSDVLFSPELVNFLINLLNGENIDYEWFANRKELRAKQDLQLEIQRLDSEIDLISNYETKGKIKKLEELDKKIRELFNIPRFDYNLLSKYYDIAGTYIKLELVEETIKYQK